jgi:hypothetical protein
MPFGEHAGAALADLPTPYLLSVLRDYPATPAARAITELFTPTVARRSRLAAKKKQHDKPSRSRNRRSKKPKNPAKPKAVTVQATAVKPARQKQNPLAGFLFKQPTPRQRPLPNGVDLQRKKPQGRKPVQRSLRAHSETYAQRDSVLVRMGYDSYAEYRASDLWHSIRQRAFIVHGERCRLCRFQAHVIHHHSYAENVLRGHDLFSLFPLCNDCHSSIEFLNGRKLTLAQVQKRFRKMMR